MDALLGGLTGVVGSGISAVFGWLGQRSKAQHEVEMARIRIDEIKAEAEANVSVAREESKATVAKGELDAFRASYTADAKSWAAGHKLGRFGNAVLAVTDFVRGTQRPLVIYTLIATTVWMTYHGHSELIDSLDYMAVTGITWLFGARTSEKMLERLHG